MELTATEEFKAAYRRLTADERRLVTEKLDLLAENYRHPSLRSRKWRAPNEWYARITRSIRLFYRIEADAYVLLTVGHHDVERRR